MSSIVILFGVIGLAIYIIVDIIQNRLRNILRRGIMYSFIFYLIVVGHLTIGDIQFPPHIGPVIIQLIPFKFVTDWFLVGQAGDWLVASRILCKQLKVGSYELLYLVSEFSVWYGRGSPYQTENFSIF
jgi:hypothetical protein